MSIWLIRQPSHPQGLWKGLGNRGEKNFILFKTYQVPKQGEMYVILYNIFFMELEHD